jgi:hypothetical protein
LSLEKFKLKFPENFERIKNMSCICAESNGINGYPTNKAVGGCVFPKYLGYMYPFKLDIEPKQKVGMEIYNPQAMERKYDKSFSIMCNKTQGTCNKVRYTSNDPRLISVAHNGQLLELDAPPINGAMKLKDIIDNRDLDDYGKRYKSYSDISAGDITYYNDRSIEDAFFNPTFVNPAFVEGLMYQDPMGSMKPQYHRTPTTHRDVYVTKNAQYRTGLSWLDDSNETREDIMSLQMRKMNQERWAPRWTGLKH